jgi:peroxiredoxin
MDLGFDVVGMSEPDHPEEGETAPDFTRPLVGDEYWEDATLSELAAESPVLLVCHPMDGSFPATYIWNELRERAVHASEATVVGLSISTPYAHKRFIAEHGLDGTGVGLFSDPTNAVAREYGIPNDLDGMAGIAEPRPATFVIDDDRTIQYAWAAREWPEFPEYDALEAALDSALDDR